ALLFVSGISILGFSYYFFLQHGEAPGSTSRTGEYAGITHDWMGDALTAFSSPVGVFTRLSPFIQKIGTYLELNLNILLALPCVLSLCLLAYMKRNVKTSYSILVFVFAVSLFSVITILYFMNRAISYEMRHFSYVAFLFTPIILQLVL